MNVMYTLKYWGIALFHGDSLKRNYFFSHYSQIFRKPLKHIRSPNSKVSKTQSSVISNLTYKAGFCAKAMLRETLEKAQTEQPSPKQRLELWATRVHDLSTLQIFQASLVEEFFTGISSNVDVHTKIK